MTVVEVSRWGGPLDTIVPGVAVLTGLALVLGGAAVALLSRASSSNVQ